MIHMEFNEHELEVLSFALESYVKEALINVERNLELDQKEYAEMNGRHAATAEKMFQRVAKLQAEL
jgi:hypothetical protein